MLAVFVTGIYNRLVALRNLFKNAFAQIDVQLQRRHDLIPNLVESAKAYLKHESSTRENVIAARNQAVAARSAAAGNPADGAAVQGLLGAEGMLSGAMGRLFAVMESYPELKADQRMKDLSEELTHTENKVAFSRQLFNDASLDYNNAAHQFPTNVVASLFGFHTASMLQATASDLERHPIKVSF